MNAGREKAEDGIVALVRETADGLGQLISEHFKLARLELVSDLKTTGRRWGLAAACAPFVVIGYGLACVGGCLFLGRFMDLGAVFAIVGGAHLLLGGVGIAYALSRRPAAQIMDTTVNEMSRSLTAITGATSGRTPLGRFHA